MQRQQDSVNHHQQQSAHEMAEDEELEREYRELRISSRMNRGIIDVDTESTLSDGLVWVIDSEDPTTDEQRYQDYISDGGTEAADRFLSDFNNLRPSISNMQRSDYKEWFRTNIYSRWCSDRCRGTGFTTDIDLADLIGMWMSYRQPPSSTDTSLTYSGGESPLDTDNQPWHSVPLHLTATMTPPRSPSVHSSISSNRYSPLAVDDDEADVDQPALTTSL